MKTPLGKSRILLVLLIVYVILDILLTPPSGLETRNPALVTTVGVITLGLLFSGLALGVVSIVLLFSRPLRGPITAMIAGILFLPAIIAEQAGYFSSLRPPVAIETVELAQTLVSLMTIFVAASINRQKMT
jgi:hypothetical protein